MNIETEVLFSFDAENPIVKRYDEAIHASQGGKFDNTLKRMRYYTLFQLVVAAVSRFPDASVSECGCWLGHSSYMIAKLLQERGITGSFHIFDSFEGLSEFQEEDASAFLSSPDAVESMRKHFRSDEERVKAMLAPYPFVTLHRGWIPSRFDDVMDEQFSLVSIDVDLYQPTLDALNFFYDRLLPGGFAYFDDYGYKSFPGARQAIDEFLARQRPSFFMESPVGCAFLIK